jgi:SOS-response transcriptional repressor LexA
MNTLQERLQEVMSAKAWGYRDLLRVSGESSSVVSQWLGRGSKIIKSIGKMEAAERIEQNSGFSALWIARGIGSKFALSGLDNVRPATIGTRAVPLINYVQAGAWTEIADNQQSQFDEYILTDLDLSDSAFALEIKGESMLPDFRPGDRIIVDPAVAPSPGKFVIAKNGNKEATFKKYRLRGINKRGEQIFDLVPLNPDFETLHSDTQQIDIIGTVVQHIRNV